MIKRLWVRIPAGVVGKFSSLGLTFCTDSYSVSIPPLYYHSGTQKTWVIVPKVQVAGYTETCIHLWPSEVRVGWQYCENLSRKQLTCNLSGNILSYSHLSSLSHCWLILAERVESVWPSRFPLKQNKNFPKAQPGIGLWKIFPSYARKKSQTPNTSKVYQSVNKKTTKQATWTFLSILVDGGVAMMDERGDEIVDDFFTVLDHHWFPLCDGTFQGQDNVRVRPIGPTQCYMTCCWITLMLATNT